MSASSSYISQKHTESGYALIKAASLPYDSFADRNGVRVPALYPTPETQLSDTITLDLTKTAGGIGYAEIANDPLYPLFMTSGDVPPNFDFVKGESSYQAFAVAPGGYIQSEFAYLQSLRSKSVQRQYGHFHGIPLNAVLAAAVDINFIIVGPNPGSFTVRPLILIAGAWTALPTADIIGRIGSVSVTLPVNMTAIRFELSVMNGDDSQVFLSYWLTTSSATPLTFPSDWTTLTGYSWPYFIQLPDIQTVRRVALEALVTFTGSDLNNGGKISSALVPAEWSPGAEDGYSSVAALRSDRYDSKLRDGTHVTWRPHQIGDLLPQGYKSFRDSSSKIVIGYQFDYPDASARMRVFGMFGFYSTNPIVGRMIYTPAITPSMMEALGEYYQNFPTCTDNPDHFAIKHFKSIAGGMGKVISMLLEHDDKIAALAASMGQPEIAAVVKAAGIVNRGINPKPSKPKAPKPAQTQSQGTRPFPKPPTKPKRTGAALKR